MSGGGGTGGAGGKDVDGIHWDKESLDLVEKGLKAAMGELKESGASATSSLQGAGFDSLSLTGMEAGHAGLAKDFEEFVEKWEWGIRALVQNANGLAQRLGLSAGMAYEEDKYRSGTMKIAANSFSMTGNPHLSEEEVTKKSYGDIFSFDSPDYSAESFRKAGDDISQDWKDTAYETTSTGGMGLVWNKTFEMGGLDDDQREALRQHAYDPSQEQKEALAQRTGRQPDTAAEGAGGEG